MSRPLPALPAGAALSLLLAAAPPGAARADGLSFRFEPSYEAADTTTVLAGGAETRSHTSALVQRYALTLDKSLFPQLRFGATGLYQWTLGSLDPSEGAPSESEGRQWSLDARITAGSPILGGVLYYDRSERSARTLADGLATSSPTLQSDTVGFSGLWRPDGLPEVQLLLTHDDRRDEDRRRSDVTTDVGQLQLLYRPDPRVDLRARLLYSDSSDRLNGLDTTAFNEEARASWTEDWLDRRISLYASYLLGGTQSETVVTGPGGSIRQQRYPLVGLSTVEAPPPAEMPTRVALKQNPQLVDGDTAAGAGLDIGFGTSPADTAWRDLGAQFADAVTPVNLVYVWVDRPLPAPVAAAFAWEAYRSDDNLVWTPVPLGGPVTFALFQNRFEIPIRDVQAKYLKVVTRPLAVGVTLDDQYRNVLVTEVQFFEALPAGTGRRISTFAGQANASSRIQLIRSTLVYDLSVSLAHGNRRPAIWNTTSALRLNRRLGRILDLGALAERSDGNDPGGGHIATTRWSASLTADPLPTLGASLTYSGDFSQAGIGESLSDAVSLSARATPYRDVNLFGVAVHNVATDAAGRTRKSDTATAGLSLAPHPRLSLSGSYAASRTVQSGGGQPDAVSTTWRVEGTASFNPVPALSASGGISYGEIDRVGQTLVNVSGTFSPFPGGNLVLSFRYNQYRDSLSDSTSLIFGPYLRWNVRPGMFVETSYTWLDISLPIQETRTRALNARLTLLL